jgi:hypothetical protein
LAIGLPAIVQSRSIQWAASGGRLVESHIGRRRADGTGRYALVISTSHRDNAVDSHAEISRLVDVKGN